MRDGAPRKIGDLGSRELVFALCHEVGNFIGAIRLHAHLIDGEMGTRDLAQASLELDHLSARCSAMLAHVRPLLLSAPEGVDEVAPDELMRSLESLMREHGVRGTALSFAVEQGLPSLQVDREVLHHMLQSLLFASIEVASAKGSVAVRSVRRCDEVAFEIEDDGEVDEDPADWHDQMQRGRPLIFAIAQDVLQKRGGRLEVERKNGFTRVAILLPAV